MYEWNEACYIPCASDRQAVERVVKRFLQLQGEDLNEGLVFREFIEFEPLASHSKSGIPLIKEFRLFVLDGQIIFSTPYWEEGDYGNNQDTYPQLNSFTLLPKKFKAAFSPWTLQEKQTAHGTLSNSAMARPQDCPQELTYKHFTTPSPPSKHL